MRPQVSIFKDHDANDRVQENREGWVSPSPRGQRRGGPTDDRSGVRALNKEGSEGSRLKKRDDRDGV